jgi:hypothetical protein
MGQGLESAGDLKDTLRLITLGQYQLWICSHLTNRARRDRDMSNFRKVHITLSPENYQIVRKAAFDAETTISQVIDTLIEETYGSAGDETEDQPPNGTRDDQSKQPDPPREWEILKLQPWRKALINKV